MFFSSINEINRLLSKGMSYIYFKVGLSPSKKNCFTWFNKNPLKMMKSASNFILKAPFVLEIFKFLSWFFVRVEKTAWLKR